jgi:hypothetical protein
VNLRRAGAGCFAGFNNAACDILHHPPHYTSYPQREQLVLRFQITGYQHPPPSGF